MIKGGKKGGDDDNAMQNLEKILKKKIKILKIGDNRWPSFPALPM